MTTPKITVYVEGDITLDVVRTAPPVDQSAEVAALTAQRDSLQAQVAALTAERDALAAKLASAKIEADDVIREAQEARDALN